MSDPIHDPDNPELTDADFARAVPFDQAPERIRAAFNKGGRPRGSDKEQVSLRIDKDVLARFRAEGAGWQTRINDALRKAAGV